MKELSDEAEEAMERDLNVLEVDIVLPQCACIECGYKMDRATGINNELKLPRPGSVSICLNCGHIAIWGEDLGLREPSNEEIKEIQCDPELLLLILKAKIIIKRRGKLHP